MHLPARSMLSTDSCRRWWVGPEQGCSPDDCRISWEIARDVVFRGLVLRAELRGSLGKRLLAECAAAGVTVVVERESMGIKWVRFEGGKPRVPKPKRA